MTETTDTTTGIPGKGGYRQAVQPVFSENPSSNYGDIDTGSGYYRNPYSSGYGMGYQDPYAGMRYMPQRGLMGPSGFGGKGGYSQPMPSPYGYPPSGGMSPGKGGYSPRVSAPEADGRYRDIPVDSITGTGTFPEQSAPYYRERTQVPDTAPTTAGEATMIEDAVMATPSAQTVAEAPSVMDAANVDFNSPTLQGAAIASDGSNVVDFTPYAGDEFVRIGDQVVSRADLQRRGSDYYTRPIQQPPMRRQMYPMYGGKGGYNPYAMMGGGGYDFGQSTGQSYEDVVRAGGGGINPVVGPNGERLYDR